MSYIQRPTSESDATFKYMQTSQGRGASSFSMSSVKTSGVTSQVSKLAQKHFISPPIEKPSREGPGWIPDLPPGTDLNMERLKEQFMEREKRENEKPPAELPGPPNVLPGREWPRQEREKKPPSDDPGCVIS
ncbi:MAG: hypothetical protein KGJ02_03550 [Verrucomicrobiota bacterium]|nr:hypothetical protein [Verrucomicrobiota bacterium]